MNTNKIMNWRPGDFQRTPHLRRVLFFGRNWDISAIFSEYTETNLLAFYIHIWWNRIENDTTEKHFIQYIYITDVPRMSSQRHPCVRYLVSFRTSLGCLSRIDKKIQNAKFRASLCYATYILWKYILTILKK